MLTLSTLVFGKNRHKKSMVVAIILSTLLLVFMLFEVLWIMFNGTVVQMPQINRNAQTIGSGNKLTYLVMGDSTAVSQGGEYVKGYASTSAKYLSKNYLVTWVNVGVSGARAKDVASMQLAKATVHKPDLVLIAVSANDVTHLTSIGSVQKSLTTTIDDLRQANSKVQIILTGSPDMGSVPRFAQPVRWYMGKRTVEINHMVAKLAKEKGVIFAPIAEKTGSTFRAHPELFAADKFHPNTQGYELWNPVIQGAIDAATK
jgi:lysophospholipase L1-like esterase